MDSEISAILWTAIVLCAVGAPVARFLQWLASADIGDGKPREER
jgi:hypothetical protein